MRLVFLNGWAASSVMLEDFIRHLAPEYEIFVLDNLYQYELVDIIAKIDALVTSDTLLIGWSLGGMLALYYASLKSNGDKVQPLILLNASACFLEKNDYKRGVKHIDFDGLKQLVAARETQALLRLFSHLLVEGSSCHKEDRRLLRQVFNEETLPDWDVLTKGLGYLETLDLRLALGSMSQPILFILGEKDALVNSSLPTNLLNNKHIKTNIISGMGHFPFGIFADEVTNIIKDYVFSLNKSVSSS